MHTDRTIEEMHCGGLILGAFPDSTYENGSIELLPGEVLVLYTDGISEAMNAREEEFGEDRITEISRAYSREPSASLLNRITESVTAFHGSTSFEDDYTLLVAKVL